MKDLAKNSWNRFCASFLRIGELGISLDISRMRFDENYFRDMEPKMTSAILAMRELERGAIANPDENRMVGHYWLRTPKLAPTNEIRTKIENTISGVKEFARDIHGGAILSQSGTHFRNVILVGIGGSALGPQLVSHALSGRDDPVRMFFVDNTDPDGIDRTLQTIGDELSDTLAIVISKSGGTIETRNGRVELAHAYGAHGLDFSKHAVCVTRMGSKLDRLAKDEAWLRSFEIWDWVGGRTSVTSAVGLLPAALQGIDIDSLLAGAREMDSRTRIEDFERNPASLLALMWFSATDGRGSKNMVILPYKDRLELLSKYLQQLVMESLGKERDRDGNIVEQGISVFGNKGSTDQHAYVQQLRDGLPDFFVTFLEVMREKTQEGESLEVEPGITSGDYLAGFLLGTREALWAKDRQSVTIGLDALDAKRLGALIALYERTVGLYASLINVNAYHQPGVEAGKKAAARIIELQRSVVKCLGAHTSKDTAIGAKDLAEELGNENDADVVYKILTRLAANPGRRVVSIREDGPESDRFYTSRH